MSLAELLPEVKTLSREDKRQLMEALQTDLEDQELLAMFPAGQIIEIWSPQEAYEAAAILQKALDDDTMTAPLRFPYTQRSATGEPTGYVPLLPLLREKDGRAQSVEALLDTGAAVNVMPYSVGAALGFVFENETIRLTLSGNLSAVPTRVIIVSATVGGFAPVRLAFAWAQTDNAPLLLGQVNFFTAFDVCFYRSQLAFEVAPKPSVP